MGHLFSLGLSLFKLFFSTLDGVAETDRMSPLRSSLSQVKSVCHYLIS